MSKEGVGYLCVTIKARVQAVSLAMADKVEFCTAVSGDAVCQSVGAARFLDPFRERPLSQHLPQNFMAVFYYLLLCGFRSFHTKT